MSRIVKEVIEEPRTCLVLDKIICNKCGEIISVHNKDDMFPDDDNYRHATISFESAFIGDIDREYSDLCYKCYAELVNSFLHKPDDK